MPTLKPLTLAFAGPGDVADTNVNDLLLDLIGTEGDDEDGFPILARDVALIFPITDGHLTPGLKAVLDWTETVDLPYHAVTDGKAGRAARKYLKDAETTTEAVDVNAALITALQDAGNSADVALVLLYGEEGDDNAETLLDLALSAELPVKDLTAGLDDISFDDGTTPEEPSKPHSAQIAESLLEGKAEHAAAEAASAPEGNEEDEEVPEDAEPVKRGRGRPRKEVLVAYWQDEEGNLTKAGRGRPRRGFERVELTEEQITEALADGRLAGEGAPEQAEEAPVSEVAEVPDEKIVEQVQAGLAYVQPTYDQGGSLGNLGEARSTLDLDNRFGYHPATETTKVMHETVRAEARNLAEVFDGLLPSGRDKSLALTHVETAMFWANAAIARSLAPLEQAA